MKQFFCNHGEGKADFCGSLHNGKFRKFHDRFICERLERPKHKIKSYIRTKSLNLCAQGSGTAGRVHTCRLAAKMSALPNRKFGAALQLHCEQPPNRAQGRDCVCLVAFFVFVCMCVCVVFWPPRRAAHADVVAADGRPPGARSCSNIPPV